MKDLTSCGSLDSAWRIAIIDDKVLDLERFERVTMYAWPTASR